MIKRSALTFLFSAAMVLGVGSAAGAQDCSASPLPAGCQPGVLPSAPGGSPTVATPVVAAPTVANPAVAAAPLPKQTLPVTGSETVALALGGTLLVAAGGALVWRSNKAAA